MPRKNEIDYLADISSALGATEGGNIVSNIVNGVSVAGSQSATQAALPARPTRQYLLIQNQSDTQMTVGFGSAGTADSLRLPANNGGVVFGDSFVPLTDIRIFCTAANKAYYILEAYTV